MFQNNLIHWCQHHGKDIRIYTFGGEHHSVASHVTVVELEQYNLKNPLRVEATLFSSCLQPHVFNEYKQNFEVW